MGSDQYCAICGGPIFALRSQDDERSTSSARAKKYRQSLVAVGRYQRYDEGNADDDEAHRAFLHNFDDPDSGDDWTGDEDSYDLGRAYDPEVMSGHDTSWLASVVFLVHDPEMKTVSKCFISNPGRFEDYNWAYATGHPERPDDELDIHLYVAYGLNDSVSYPFHSTCLQMFARCATGTQEVKALDPDLLYEVMIQELHRLDHGEISGQEQYWECVVGEEFCVIDPSEVSTLGGDQFRALLHEHARLNKDGHRLPQAVTDPFSSLSNELIVRVTDFLTGHDIIKLSQASTIVYRATDDNGFWRSLVSREMDWLWDTLPELIAAHKDLDWKRFYTSLDHATSQLWGMRGEYMSLANRRRIWYPCSQLAVHYQQRLESARAVEDDLRSHAISLQMPVVSYPDPNKSSPFCETINSWGARASALILSLAWNERNELAGISPCGLQEESYAYVNSYKIDKGDWLQSMILFMEPIDLTDAGASSAVVGVVLFTSSGRTHHAGDTSAGHVRRYVAPSDGRDIVGFQGRFDEGRHRLYSLSILEAYQSPEVSAAMENDYLERGEEPAAPQTSRFAWAPGSTLLPGTIVGNEQDDLYQIWQHPTILMQPFSWSSFDDGKLRKDLIPMQAIVYDLTNVTGIEVMLVPTGMSTTAHGEIVRDNTAIIGIRMCLGNEESKQPWSTVGEFPPPEDYRDMYGCGPDGYLQRFEINGPGGEFLVSLNAEISQGLKAIRFRTNRGREVTFGSGSGNNFWNPQDFSSSSDVRMVGLVCGFATMGYAPKEKKQNTRLTCITSLTVNQ